MVLTRNVYTIGFGQDCDFDILRGFATYFKVENGRLKLLGTAKQFKTTVHISNPEEWYIYLENQPYQITNYDIMYEIDEDGLRLVISNFSVNYSCCTLL